MNQNRHSLRLQHYNYAQAGAYFLTICTSHRQHLFGHIEEGQMHLNDAGRILQAAWEALPNHYPHVELDAWVVMPNHVHAVVVIAGQGSAPADFQSLSSLPSASVSNEFRSAGTSGPAPPVGAGFKPAHVSPPQNPASTSPRRHALPEIVRALKTFSARGINVLRNMPATPVWQRGYFEHVIRNEPALARIREYIAANPANWAHDSENAAQHCRSDFASEAKQLLRAATR